MLSRLCKFIHQLQEVPASLLSFRALYPAKPRSVCLDRMYADKPPSDVRKNNDF